MVAVTRSAHAKRTQFMLGEKPTDHRLAGVLDTKKRSSTACQFERALREPDCWPRHKSKRAMCS
jgi:hypothetical protein